MTIAFAELGGTRGQRSSTFNAIGQNRHTRTFQAITSDGRYEQVGIFTAWLDYYAVTMGQYYTCETPDGLVTDPYSYLNSVTVNESAEDCVQWNITAIWDAFDPAMMGGFNPLLAPFQKNITFENREEAADWVYNYDPNSGEIILDDNGYPVITLIRNSTGDVFTEPVTRVISEPVLRIVRNESGLNHDLLALISSTINCVNLGAFLGFPSRTVKFSNVEMAYNYHPRVPGGTYLTCTYMFRINWNTWTKQIMDIGYKALDPGDGLVKPIMIPGGFALQTTPQLLDGTGHLLPLNTSPPTPPVYLPFELSRPIDFSIFQFV